jgi:hypothetical protein
MKTLFHLLVCAALMIGAASMAVAGPGPQYWETMRQTSQFKKLKAGDKIAYVCNMCKKTVKVVMKQSRNDAPTHTEVVYVNDKGEECMFIAKVADKK